MKRDEVSPVRAVSRLASAVLLNTLEDLRDGEQAQQLDALVFVVSNQFGSWAALAELDDLTAVEMLQAASSPVTRTLLRKYRGRS